MNPVRRQWLTLLTLCCVVALGGSAVMAPSAWSGKTRSKSITLKGEVTAVNAGERPPIVMMKVITKEGEEMLVGAIVQDSTTIRKKGQNATVEDLLVGDPLILTYQKSEIGALAQSMVVPDP